MRAAFSGNDRLAGRERRIGGDLRWSDRGVGAGQDAAGSRGRSRRFGNMWILGQSRQLSSGWGFGGRVLFRRIRGVRHGPLRHGFREAGPDILYLLALLLELSLSAKPMLLLASFRPPALFPDRVGARCDFVICDEVGRVHGDMIGCGLMKPKVSRVIAPSPSFSD